MPYSDPDKQRDYQRRWMAERRNEWLQMHGPCVDCASWNDLQVDHTDAASKVTHRVWSWSKARQDIELSKCVVRCGPCHHLKTAVFREYAREENHGSAKLNRAKVLVILTSSLSNTQLATEYGVHERTVRKVRSRISWADSSVDRATAS